MELAPERLLTERRGLEQAVEIDAGIDAHRCEEVHQVLGADIAGKAAAVFHLGRMSADAAERRVEVAHAGFVRGDAVHETGAARVVKVGDRNKVLNLRNLGKDLFYDPWL